MGTCLLGGAPRAFAATVGDFLEEGCSTGVVDALSRQIAAEVTCLAPGALEVIEEGGGVVFETDHVLPLVSPEGKAGLEAAARSQGGSLEVTSLYRTVAQQLLLHAWWSQGSCGIAAAAEPGASNHESGRAVDLADPEAWIDALADEGWEHDVPGDEVHFDHAASADLSGLDVLAFQRLWNRNRPDDPLDEDGEYGPATERRLLDAPAQGFPTGACAGEIEQVTLAPEAFGAGGGGCAVPRGAPAGSALPLLLLLAAILRSRPN